MVVTELLAKFADPEVIHTLSVADKLIAGLVATILGMGITFSALIILQFVIVLMDKLTRQPAQPATPSPQPTPSPDKELIAVISSVIAMQLKTPVSNIIIKNIEKIDPLSPPWSMAGIREQMNNRF